MAALTPSALIDEDQLETLEAGYISRVTPDSQIPTGTRMKNQRGPTTLDLVVDVDLSVSYRRQGLTPSKA